MPTNSKEYMAKYREKNRLKYNAKHREWNKKNPKKLMEIQMRYLEKKLKRMR